MAESLRSASVVSFFCCAASSSDSAAACSLARSEIAADSCELGPSPL